MKKIVVLISNKVEGTNLKAIIYVIDQKKINAEIIAVISEMSDAPGLVYAEKNNLPTEIGPNKEVLVPILQKYHVDYVWLGGWKQFIADNVMKAFKNKILNVVRIYKNANKLSVILLAKI